MLSGVAGTVCDKVWTHFLVRFDRKLPATHISRIAFDLGTLFSFVYCTVPVLSGASSIDYIALLLIMLDVFFFFLPPFFSFSLLLFLPRPSAVTTALPNTFLPGRCARSRSASRPSLQRTVSLALPVSTIE